MYLVISSPLTTIIKSTNEPNRIESSIGIYHSNNIERHSKPLSSHLLPLPPSSNFLTTYSTASTRFARDPPSLPPSLPSFPRSVFYTGAPFRPWIPRPVLSFAVVPFPFVSRPRQNSRRRPFPRAFEILSAALSFPLRSAPPRFCASPGIVKFPGGSKGDTAETRSFLLRDYVRRVYTFISVAEKGMKIVSVVG